MLNLYLYHLHSTDLGFNVLLSSEASNLWLELQDGITKCNKVFFNTPATIRQQDILKSMILESNYYSSAEAMDRVGKMEMKENLTGEQKFELYILQKFFMQVEKISISAGDSFSKFSDMLEYAVRLSQN